MLAPRTRRFVVLGLTLSLGLILTVFGYGAFASAATVTVFTPHGTAYCERTGAYAPAVHQTHTFLTRFDYYRVAGGPAGPNPEPIEVDITFPDGRVFTVTASALLDGVIDMPTNFPFATVSNVAGQVSLNLTVPGQWPYGCYTITGRGLFSGGLHNANGYFVVTPGGQPGPTGNVSLWISRLGQNISAAFQGDLVEADARGFIGGEYVSFWLTAPDGTVINFPPGQQVLQTAPNGAVSTSFQFEGKNPVGMYTFTALGNTSGARAFAQFELRSRPVSQSGPARLNVVVPAGQAGPQRTIFYLNGDLFWPAERVDLWLTLPDGAVRGFPSTFSDGISGAFMAELFLDERLPTGFYQLTAQGAESRQLVIASFNLQQTTDTIINPDPGPEIGLDNNPATIPDLIPIDPPVTDPAEAGNPDE
ncbi:MAG: hypothetical protein HC822_11655 [Oscillochloris sp.]|nr:hypothetical protein [Oscillochloris sp.]